MAESKIRADQLSGPGVPGMEHDPPLYHFDIDQDNLDKLRADSVGFLKRLGIGREQGIAPNGAMNRQLALANPAWSANGWVDVPLGARGWCCHVVGDTTTCYNHADGPPSRGAP